MILAYEKLLLMVKNNLIINPSIIAAIHKDRAFAITKPNLLQNFAKADTEKQRDTISEENEATTKPFTRLPSIQYGSFQRRAKLIIAAKPTPINPLNLPYRTVVALTVIAIIVNTSAHPYIAVQ